MLKKLGERFDFYFGEVDEKKVDAGDARELEKKVWQLRHTVGETKMATGSECGCRATYVDHRTGTKHNLGQISYYSKSRTKRIKYRIKRRLGLV